MKHTHQNKPQCIHCGGMIGLWRKVQGDRHFCSLKHRELHLALLAKLGTERLLSRAFQIPDPPMPDFMMCIE
jgi:hypothetical protein